MKTNKQKHQPGICPICGSDEMTYSDTHKEDDWYWYDWRCDKCNSTGTEDYELSFTGHDVREDNSIDICNTRKLRYKEKK